MKRHGLGFAVLGCLFALTGCGSDDTGARLALNVTKVSTSHFAHDLIHAGVPQFFIGDRAVGDSGSNTAAQLESLKYVFGFISICEGLTTNGSSFSNPTNCIQIYDGPTVGDGSSSAITPSNLASYASSQIDLMDATSRARLNGAKALTTSDARSYNWAVLNWYTPIAVKASLDVQGATLRTKAATSYDVNNVAQTTADLSAGSTAEESVVISPNGGSFFKFQSPFVISSADISAGTSYVVDLVFNPEGLISGNKNVASTPTFSGQLYSSAQQAIYVPMIQLTPVPRKSTETSKKETYLIDLGTAGKTRLELYYNAADTAKTIYGVNLQNVITSTQDGSYAQTDNGAKIIEVSTVGGTLSLKDNYTPQNTIVSGLTREADGTATVTWLGGIGASPVSKSYTYVGTFDVQ
jgi:hypothetical protein